MYEFKTTFWMDFSIAERFGEEAIRDTYKRAFKEWHKDIEYVTELELVLNWKLWYHYENGHDEYAKLYDELWKKHHSWCANHLKGDDLRYWFEATD